MGWGHEAWVMRHEELRIPGTGAPASCRLETRHPAAPRRLEAAGPAAWKAALQFALMPHAGHAGGGHEAWVMRHEELRIRGTGAPASCRLEARHPAAPRRLEAAGPAAWKAALQFAFMPHAGHAGWGHEAWVMRHEERHIPGTGAPASCRLEARHPAAPRRLEAAGPAAWKAALQ